MSAIRTPIALVALCAALAGVGLPATAQAASRDPLFTFTPESPPKTLPVPPPAGNLEGPCGLTVDSAGRFYASDYDHDTVDAFKPKASPFSAPPEYIGQRSTASSLNGPCAPAIDSLGRLYVDELHGKVTRFPTFGSGSGTTIDPGPATGVVVDPATNKVYVDDGDRISVYEPSGSPVVIAGQPLHIGAGSLEEGYGIAISDYSATAGFLYVPDAATEKVKVFDPATDTDNPVATIDGGQTPPGAFNSLRDSAVAVDDATGEVYLADDLQPGSADRPEAAIYVFSHTGAYEGRLKYNIVDARPPGLAVDNSGGAGGEGEGEQSRVYVTSGNTERASVIAYGPDSAGSVSQPAPEGTEPLPPGGCACGVLPEPPPPVTCEGDSCQHLPSEPTDPALNTLIEGAANPPVRFHDTNRLAHYLRLRRHHGPRREGKSPARRSRRVYRGKTSQKLKIQLSSAPGQISLVRFKVNLLCRDGSLLHADLSDFEASPFNGGRFSDSQHGPTDSVSWHGRLKASRASGSLRVKDRLKSGVRCDSGLVRFSVRRVG